MTFQVEGPEGRSETIVLRCAGPKWRPSDPPPATLGSLRMEIFARFGIAPFEQRLVFADDESSVIAGDGSNPLDAPFLKLQPAIERPLTLRLSAVSDPRHASEKKAA